MSCNPGALFPPAGVRIGAFLAAELYLLSHLDYNYHYSFQRVASLHPCSVRGGGSSPYRLREGGGGGCCGSVRAGLSYHVDDGRVIVSGLLLPARPLIADAGCRSGSGLGGRNGVFGSLCNYDFEFDL